MPVSTQYWSVTAACHWVTNDSMAPPQIIIANNTIAQTSSINPNLMCPFTIRTSPVPCITEPLQFIMK